jgi:hypothetical protein
MEDEGQGGGRERESVLVFAESGMVLEAEAEA